MIIYWNSEASFLESPIQSCSQDCERCPQGGSIIDITDDSAEKFQSTNGKRGN